MKTVGKSEVQEAVLGSSVVTAVSGMEHLQIRHPGGGGRAYQYTY